MQSYRDLVVWQRGMELVREGYKLTEGSPQSERYGLTSQVRRAAVSIPSNLAEGYARKRRQEYIQFARIAFGLGAELETQLQLPGDLGFVSDEDLKHTAWIA